MFGREAIDIFGGLVLKASPPYSTIYNRCKIHTVLLILEIENCRGRNYLLLKLFLLSLLHCSSWSANLRSPAYLFTIDTLSALINVYTCKGVAKGARGNCIPPDHSIANKYFNVYRHFILR